MKLAALFFFIQTFPLVVLIATLLYGGFSTTALKEELAKSGMYEKIISFTKDSSDEENIDSVFAILQNHLNPDYLQIKIEGVVDDTTLWVTGKTETPPALSFKDIKDEIEANNPTLFTDMQQISQEMQTAVAAENGEMTRTNQPNELETFIKNDFSIPLKDTFAGIKQVYIVLTIALPVLSFLLILSLVGLGVLNKTWQKRSRWFGVTFLLAGTLGVATIFFNQNLLTNSLGFLLEQNDQMVQMIYPLIERILTIFVTQHAIYQTIANYILFGVGIVSLVLSFVIKSPVVSSAPVKTTKPATKKSR